MARYRLSETTIADLPRIFEIGSDPMVLQQQYPPWRGMTPEVYRRFVRAGTFRCTSIFADEQIIGDVWRMYSHGPRSRVCYCSWNLLPGYWGRGIMPAALTALFDYMFTQDGVTAVVADCFATNDRCLRVLEKLGFCRCRLGAWAAIGHFIKTKGQRKVLRFRLTAEQWATRSTRSEHRGSPVAWTARLPGSPT